MAHQARGVLNPGSRLPAGCLICLIRNDTTAGPAQPRAGILAGVRPLQVRNWLAGEPAAYPIRDSN